MLTAALKKHAEGQLGVAPSATDDVYEATIQKALQEGKLTGVKYAELLTAKDADPMERLATLIGNTVEQAVTKAFGGSRVGEGTESIRQPTCGGGRPAPNWE